MPVGKGGAFGQPIDEWLVGPHPAPAVPPSSQPRPSESKVPETKGLEWLLSLPRPSVPKEPEPKGPETSTRTDEWPSPAPAVAPSLTPAGPSLPKEPASKWPEIVTRTIDDLKTGIEEVTKTVDGQETIIKHVVRRNPGGSIDLQVAYWTLVAIQGGEVEIRGPCGSACTLAVVAIPKDKLCFDADGYLGFHVATSLNKDGSKSPDLKTTRGMVCRLDSPSDNEVLQAARKLVSELKAHGSDIRTLAAALEKEWEKQQKAKPPPLRPIDWSEVDAAITQYVADKSTVTVNKLLRAIQTRVPAFEKDVDMSFEARMPELQYVERYMARLGFKEATGARVPARY
jgi:hypothetical protein